MKNTSKREDFTHDPNFVVATPTKVLTATKGQTTIVTKLYGPVDDARLALEQRMCDHRADQLNPVPKRPERIERDPGNVSFRDDVSLPYRTRRDRCVAERD